MSYECGTSKVDIPRDVLRALFNVIIIKHDIMLRLAGMKHLTCIYGDD